MESFESSTSTSRSATASPEPQSGSSKARLAGRAALRLRRGSLGRNFSSSPSLPEALQLELARSPPISATVAVALAGSASPDSFWPSDLEEIFLAGENPASLKVLLYAERLTRQVSFPSFLLFLFKMQGESLLGKLLN